MKDYARIDTSYTRQKEQEEAYGFTKALVYTVIFTVLFACVLH